MRRALHFAGFVAIALLSGTAGAEPVTIELIDANPAAGFNFPYVLRVPLQLRSQDLALVVETNNTGNRDNFQGTIDATKAAAAGNGLGPLVSEALKIPLLMPVFPRTNADPLVYTHALDRDTVLIENGSRARLDKQVLRMVEDARSRLAGRAWTWGAGVHRVVWRSASARGTAGRRWSIGVRVRCSTTPTTGAIRSGCATARCSSPSRCRPS